MAARKGIVTFGLVSVPVELHPAARSTTLDFDLLHASCKTRIKYQLYCPRHERAVSRKEVVKAYRVNGGYVVMTDEDFDKAERASSRAIEVVEFVDEAAVDPVYLERSYFVAPQADAERPYAVLRAAMQKAQKAAVITFVMSNRQQYGLLRPAGEGLTLHTLYYGDEVREVAVSKKAKDAGDREVAFAEQYIKALTREFDPTRYKDEYREKLLAIIRAKAKGKEPALPEVPRAPGKVVDLMAALRASVEQARNSPARAARTGRSRSPRRPAAERRRAVRKAA